jgi:hypothetical protein
MTAPFYLLPLADEKSLSHPFSREKVGFYYYGEIKLTPSLFSAREAHYFSIAVLILCCLPKQRSR